MAHKLTQERDAVLREAHRVNKPLYPTSRRRYDEGFFRAKSDLQYDALRYVNAALRPAQQAPDTGSIPFYSRSESNAPMRDIPGFVCEVGTCEYYAADRSLNKVSEKKNDYPVGKKAMSAFIRQSQENMIRHLLAEHRSIMAEQCSICSTSIKTSSQVSDVLRKHCRNYHLSQETRPDAIPQHLARRMKGLLPIYNKYNITLPQETLTLARNFDKTKAGALLRVNFLNPGIQKNNQGWKVAGQLPLFDCGGRLVNVLAPALNTLKDSDYSPNHVNKDAYCKFCDFELGDGYEDDYESMSRRHKHWLGTSLINQGVTFESLQLPRHLDAEDIGCSKAQLDLHKKAGAYLRTGSVICQSHKLRFSSPAETWKHWREQHQILESEKESRAFLWPSDLQFLLGIQRLSFGPASRRGSSVA